MPSKHRIVVTANKIGCSVSSVDITACAGKLTFGTKVKTINALGATGRWLAKGSPTFPLVRGAITP